MRLCFVDSLGLLYTGDTLARRGLGGSESAVIFLSRELANLGVDVTVYCHCEKEGTYSGVIYKDLAAINDGEVFDVMIASRSVLPLLPPQHINLVNWSHTPYEQKLSSSKFKALWLHDTFVEGDQWVESLLVDGFYDEIFTLSDWHSHYIMGAQHYSPRPRRHEVLKHKIFQTRNGINATYGEVDIKAKDPDLFVYNSSVSKGMVPLLETIWPEVKRQIPAAKLVIIGGYYRGANKGEADEQEIKFYKLVDQYNGQLGISFTDVITQKEVAEYLVKASFMIYPAIFPETFGISTLEAINCNVPLLGCRFGALEEIGLEQTSYLIDYPIDWDDGQTQRFIRMVVTAYKDKYLLQQKMYACNEVKPYIGWDTVALQWKQHLYRKLGLYLDLDETREARRRISRINKIFGRRYINLEDQLEYRSYPQHRIVVVTPFYNSADYLEKCIRSVAAQDYDNWIMYMINDLSDDNSLQVIEKTVMSLPETLRGKFFTLDNQEKKYALRNQVEAINQFGQSDDIIVLLDGDDWLINDPDIFDFINNQYNEGAKITYGSCRSLVDNIDLIAQPYPASVHQNQSYRTYKFNWGIPYTHLRTFRKELFDRIDPHEFLDEQGDYYRAGHDNALFYPLLENVSDTAAIKCLQRVMYVYNDANPLNDYKVHGEEQNKNAAAIRSGKSAASRSVVDGKKASEIEALKTDIVDKVRAKDPKAIKIYKDIAVNRKDVWIEDPDYGLIAPRREWLLKKIGLLTEGKDPASIKILDVGSWTGTIAQNLYSNGYTNITCLDISTEVIKLGSTTYPHLKWVCGDVEYCKFEEKFDIILMCEVLEHVSRPKHVIERALDWVTEKGSIVYTIPEESNVFGEVLGNNSPEHISRIAKAWLDTISNDLEIIKTTDDGGTIAYEWYVGSISEDSYDGVIDMGEVNAVGSLVKKALPAEVVPMARKKILIALPTAKYIETETFKSIYRLDVPPGCDTHLECFYGYRIDQVRNLICHYAVTNKFDYVLFVDSDIILPEDTLKKLIQIDQDVVTGVYIQRKPGAKIPEIYVDDGYGGMKNIDPANLGSIDQECAGCGFGCCLVKVATIKKIDYPQFSYHHAIRIEDTISEDVDFCIKARRAGAKIYYDPTLRCDHIGSTIFKL